MQTHVSINTPLMTLPISYLDTTSLAKWRQTSKENQDTSSIFYTDEDLKRGKQPDAVNVNVKRCAQLIDA